MFIALIMEECVRLRLLRANIGLITSLATYAKVSEYGFMKLHMEVVNEDQSLSDEVKYFSALRRWKNKLSSIKVT